MYEFMHFDFRKDLVQKSESTFQRRFFLLEIIVLLITVFIKLIFE